MSDSQKFLSRNRAPRVQIEYDVELYGAEKKVQLPFVMRVMSDLSGKAEKPSVADRTFLEIDADNFDERMQAMAPKAQFTVPNTLTGEGTLEVDLTFSKMSDFSPEAIAERVDTLAPLLEARRKLSNLMAYMDGKSGAEALIENLLASPELLSALVGTESASDDMDAALDALKARLPEIADENDTTDSTLASLAAKAPDDPGPDTSIDDALGSLEMPEETKVDDEQDLTLEALRQTPVQDAEDDDGSDGVLGSLAEMAPSDAPEVDETAEILSGIERREEEASEDPTGDILAATAKDAPVEPEDSAVEDALASIDTTIPETPAQEDNSGVLEELRNTPTATEEENETDDILSALEPVEPTGEEAADLDDVLAMLEDVETPEQDGTADRAVLETLKDMAPEVEDESDSVGDILSSLDPVSSLEQEKADIEEILGGLEESPQDSHIEESAEDILASLDPVEFAGGEDTRLDDVLASIEVAPEAEAETSDLDDVLGGLETVDQTVAVDTSEDILASLEITDPETPETENIDDILGALETTPGTDSTEDHDDILSGLEIPPEETQAEESADDILASLDEADVEEPEDATLEDVLGTVEEAAEPEPNEESLDDILDGLDAPDVTPVNESQFEDVLAQLEMDQPGVSDELSSDDVVGDQGSTLGDEASEDDLDQLLAGLDTSDTEQGPDAVSDNVTAEEPAETEVMSAESTSDPHGTEPDETAELGDDLDALLADLGAEAEETTQHPVDDPDLGDDLDALLAGLETDDGDSGEEAAEEKGNLPRPEPAEEDADDGLGALLAELEVEAQDEAAETVDVPTLDGTDDLTTGSASDGDDKELATSDDGDLDALLADLDLGAQDAEPAQVSENGDQNDLDALLADIADDGTDSEKENPGDDLDALMADLKVDATETDETPDESGVDDLDALLAELGGDDEGDNAASGEDANLAGEQPNAPRQSPFGTISVPRPERDSLNRNRFRMAIFGDFTGRASRGLREVGPELAARKPTLLDVDTIEEVIERFATSLTLPIGKDGNGIAVRLKELDDLHPDELYENVEIFEALNGLRQQLSVGSMAEKVVDRLSEWSEEYSTPVRLPKVSAATSVPANLKLSDFQALIGDTAGVLTQASPADDLIAQIVGPHIVNAPDAGVDAMREAVDEALSSAMRLVLHHPDFQAVEAQWRSLDLLARRIETDSSLEIVLYDVSAEELAVDLSAQEDLSESGLFKLLTDVLDPEEGAGGFSALFGLYTFEETPPHAELLARIGQVAGHVDAPFFAAMTPAYLDTAKEDRHPLVTEAWDKLRAEPEAAYIGLASPKFLLRLPYGAKSEPIYAFEFEEFTAKEGLSGMLWANPVVLVAILMAGTYKKDGKAMDLGSLLSLGDMPFHYVTDRYGDQVALPCTERNLTSDPAQHTLARGYMPVLSIKGRNEIRLGSFRSLAGDEIAGPWSGTVPPPKPPPGKPGLSVEMEIEAADEEDASSQIAGDDTGNDEGADASLDDLLAGFDAEPDNGEDDDEMDPELAALLEGL